MRETTEPIERGQDSAIADLVERTTSTEPLSESLARRVAYLEELAAIEKASRATGGTPPVKRKPDPDHGPGGGEPTGLIALLFAVALGAVLLYRWWAGDDAE